MRLGTGMGAVFLVAAAGACATLADDLRKAQDAYEEARYENALTWLASLDREEPSMDRPTAARFHYLRGMTAHRLGDEADARHHLALARAIAGDTAVLPTDWKRTMDRTLAELDAAPGEETPHE